MTARRPLAIGFLVLALSSLALLSALSIRAGGHAVRSKVEDSLRLSARLSAVYVRSELTGLAEVTESFARRPTIVTALRGGMTTPADRRYVRLALGQLISTRPGIGTTFLADARGRLIDILPATPSIIGKDFSYRDWYKGVLRTRRAYVSEAYRSLADGRPLVVAVAAPVFERGPGSRVLGVIVAAYRLDQIRRFAQRVGSEEGVRLEVFDQRGVSVTSGAGALVSQRDDPGVTAALDGRAGISEQADGSAKMVVAYAPVPRVGWVVVTRVAADRAFAAVGRVRREVLLIAVLVAGVVLVGAALLARALRERDSAEAETELALDSAQRHSTVNRAVLEAIEEGLVLVGLDGRVISFNRRMAEIAEQAGVREKLQVGAALADIQASIVEDVEAPDAYLAVTEQAAADPEIVISDEWTLVSTGQTFARSLCPVRDADGCTIARIVALREITAEREAERLKSELVATVSHELRTPLASILGFTELLTEREYDPATQAQFLRTIRSETDRLTRLVNDFLDLQRIESGSFTLSLEPFDLGELVGDQVGLFRGQSGAHSIEVDLPAEPIRALGEPERICQVMANLLSNAIKYSPSGGTVTVRVALEGAAARVSVRDSGIGIPEAEQRKIFSKFFRVDTSDTREIGGTGLGLSLCRDLVEAHGGRIGFESTEGEGSTFWFELPVAVSASEEGRPRVLLVEDDPTAVTLLREYLSAGDYDIEVAASAEEAFERLQARAPDVVCLDIGLGDGLDGWDVIARMKAEAATAEIPVVVCTGGNGKQRAAALGVSDFLSKPFDSASLRRAVERALPDGPGGSVLVVDDDDVVRALVVEALGGDGVELREAADGREALTKIAARRPDAVILDLQLPHVDGFGVLERLQAAEPTRDIPVIVLTGRRLLAEERNLLRARATALLEKDDYSGVELRALVDRALR